MDFSEKWGKDVDEAVRLALLDLKCSEEEVDVIVLEEPTKGFLGLGAKLAKVRVEKKKQPQPEKKEKPVQVKEVKEVKEIKKEVEPIETKVNLEEKVIQMDSKFTLNERPADLVETFEGPAIEFLKDITSKMGLDLSIKAFQNETHLYVEMEGKDSGTIIGKRGQTLDSIQYLTSLVVNKNKEKYIRVVVDAENYRAKREQTLEQLANRLADKVIKTGRSVRLEPMNPYERKVIHATLQQNSKVTTKSEGEEPFRRVVVDIK